MVSWTRHIPDRASLGGQCVRHLEARHLETVSTELGPHSYGRESGLADDGIQIETTASVGNLRS